MLKNIYSAESGRTLGMFYLEDGTAEFRSMFQVEESLKL